MGLGVKLDYSYLHVGGRSVDSQFSQPRPHSATWRFDYDRQLCSFYVLFVPQRWQGAAALSAAVTTTTLQEIAPIFQAEPSQQKRTSQTPAALREGARGRGFSQRSRLPRIPPSLLLLEKRPPPEFSHPRHLYVFCA